MFEVLFAGQIPKDLDYPELTEDTLLFASNRMSLAISDGASESYDSKKWADLIVENYVNDPYLCKKWVSDIQKKYLSTIDFASLSWSKQSSFERGSFATLLGIKEIASGELEVTAIGDCECVILRSDLSISYAIPYQNSIDFDNRPQLISTKSELNDFLDSGNLVKIVSVKSDDIILLMSDAIACWMLKCIESSDDKWKRLLSINSNQELFDLVIEERLNHHMKVDDVTLILVQSVEDLEYELSNIRAI